MAVHLYRKCLTFLAIISLTACSQTESNNIKKLTVNVDNSVESCVGLSINSVEEKAGLLTAMANIKPISNVGNCGCKSALLSFYTQIDGVDIEPSRGTFSALVSQSLNIPLATISIADDANIQLMVQCANQP